MRLIVPPTLASSGNFIQFRHDLNCGGVVEEARRVVLNEQGVAEDSTERREHERETWDLIFPRPKRSSNGSSREERGNRSLEAATALAGWPVEDS